MSVVRRAFLLVRPGIRRISGRIRRTSITIDGDLLVFASFVDPHLFIELCRDYFHVLDGSIMLFDQHLRALRLDNRIDLGPIGHGAMTVNVATADLDEDGDVDIVTANSIGGVQTIHFGGR